MKRKRPTPRGITGTDYTYGWTCCADCGAFDGCLSACTDEKRTRHMCECKCGAWVDMDGKPWKKAVLVRFNGDEL